jgi:hypothetical protein
MSLNIYLRRPKILTLRFKDQAISQRPVFEYSVNTQEYSGTLLSELTYFNRFATEFQYFANFDQH